MLAGFSLIALKTLEDPKLQNQINSPTVLTLTRMPVQYQIEEVVKEAHIQKIFSSGSYDRQYYYIEEHVWNICYFK